MFVGGGGVGVFPSVRVGLGLGASVAVGVRVGAPGASVGVRDGVGEGVSVPPGVTDGVPDALGVSVAAGVAVSVLTAIVTEMRGETSRSNDRPPIKGRGLGCTRRTTSRYQTLSVGGSLPHPSGPSYRRQKPSTVSSIPSGTRLRSSSKPTPSRRNPWSTSAQRAAGPRTRPHAGKGSGV